MRRSDPTLILLPVLSIIQSALLGKEKKGYKGKRTHKQINNYSLSDNSMTELSLPHVFALIYFDQMGHAMCNDIVYLNIIYGPVPHFFSETLTVVKAKQNKTKKNRITD